MTFVSPCLPILIIVTSFCFISTASAQTGPAESSVSSHKSASTAVEASAHLGVGYFAGVVGATALVHHRWLTAGAFLEEQFQVLGWSNVGYAGVVGVGHHFDLGLRVDLLGSCGMHRYEGAGRGSLFSGDPGTSGNTMFTGVRFGLSRVFFSGPVHLNVGVWTILETDITRPTKQYQFQDASWFGESTLHTSEQTIGTTFVGGAVRIGGTLDI